VVFEADYDKIELQKKSYDVISVTSSPLRHRKTAPKLRHNFFPNLGPSQSKFLATPVLVNSLLNYEMMLLAVALLLNSICFIGDELLHSFFVNGE